jgi:hypothetical protein
MINKVGSTQSLDNHRPPFEIISSDADKHLKLHDGIAYNQ